jgi:TatD DNase family protein
MILTDSHAHVFWEAFDADRAAVLARARAAGVERMLLVGTNVESSRAAFALSEREPGTFPTAGIHPHDAAAADDAARREIDALCRREGCVGVGETGLDYFKRYSPREAQLASFRWHLALARSIDKPVIVHCRDAHEDVVALLRDARGVRGVMHCYTMGVEELAPYLELGFLVSFSGVVTYPKNEANRAAARAVPADRLLVETDCPFLAPQSRRGQRNEPAFLRSVVDAVAGARGAEPAEIARVTSENAARLFGLPPLDRGAREK